MNFNQLASGQKRVNHAHRLVQIGILISLLWKISFFIYANRVYETISIRDSFFPDLLRSSITLRTCFLGTIFCTVVNVFSTNRSLQKSCNFGQLSGLSLLCLHQGTYNDMTFLTSWWCAVWSWWIGNRFDIDPPEELLKKAAFLARLIVSVIFLGGAVGKWTSEYWSGQVLYDIYFVDRDYWTFNYLRSNYNADQLKWLALCYSRLVIILETLAGFGLWLLKDRVAACLSILLLTLIALSSNLLLFSVTGCLIALSSVGFLTTQPNLGRAQD